MRLGSVLLLALLMGCGLFDPPEVMVEPKAPDVTLTVPVPACACTCQCPDRHV